MIRRTNSTTPEQAEDLNQPVDLFAGPINLDMISNATSNNTTSGHQEKQRHQLKDRAKAIKKQQTVESSQPVQLGEQVSKATQKAKAKSVPNKQNKTLLRQLDQQQAAHDNERETPEKDPNLRK